MSGYQPRKRPRQKRAQATVNAIVEATARLLVEGGYEKANTNRIAELAGVSVGSLYQYFPNKESLVMAVIERHSETMLGRLQRSVQEFGDEPIPVAVRTYIKAMVDAHRTDPALHRVIVQQVLHLGLEYVRELEERARVLVQHYLEKHRDAILPKNLEVASFVLMAMVQSIVHRAVMEKPELLASGALTEEISVVVLRYLLGGSLQAE